MLVSEIYLVTRNGRDKVQVAFVRLDRNGETFTISRKTGQYNGKMTDQPSIIIEKGKAKRSNLQQAQLQYNSLIKNYLDKGYKKLEDLTDILFGNLNEATINELVPRLKTDQNGNIKPQLAKPSKDCTVNIWDKPMYCSRKIDGVRNLFKLNEGEIISISRGGEDYNVATTKLKQHPKLISLFEEFPDIILDGELYHHGWSLQQISGTCRLKTWDERCEKIEFWIYDIADDTKTFNERLEILKDLKDFFEDTVEFKVLDHYLLNGWGEVEKYHNKFVSEGFEGLVARKPDKKYAPGKRSSDWIKVKCYLEDTFEIIGFKEGLRREDFVFELITKEGKTFEAKPIGTRADKEEYRENMDDIIGRFGEVKYFVLSDKGIPTQTTFRAVRYDIKG